jgi:hypothetical protein
MAVKRLDTWLKPSHRAFFRLSARLRSGYLRRTSVSLKTQWSDQFSSAGLVEGMFEMAPCRANTPFSPIVREGRFRFERRFLNSQKEIEPRWKRCVSTADRLLEALGRLH